MSHVDPTRADRESLTAVVTWHCAGMDLEVLRRFAGLAEAVSTRAELGELVALEPVHSSTTPPAIEATVELVPRTHDTLPASPLPKAEP